MLVAYFDESGTHQDSKAVCIGGFVADSHAWRKLGQDWRRILVRYEVPYFHAAELEHHKGVYREWSKEKKLAFQVEITGAIEKRLPASLACGVAAGVVVDEYEKQIPVGSDLREILGTPYIHCVWQCISRVYDWITAENRPGPIRLVFEKGGPSPGELSEIIKVMQNSKPHLGELAFAEKGSHPGLEVADFHAYEAYKDAINRGVGETRRGIRKSLEAILSPTGNVHGYFLVTEKLSAFVLEAKRLLAGMAEPPDNDSP